MSERCAIRLIGVGGGGCNALRYLARVWTECPSMAVVHTDAQVLETCDLPMRVLLDPMTTGGLSAGGDPEVGQRAAEASTELLRPLFADVDLAVLVGGLGGGSATGALPVLAKIAREAGALSLCFCTLPFFFEGVARRRRAEEGLIRLRKAADATIVFPNQRLTEWVQEDTSLSEAFGMVDRITGNAIRAVWKLLSQPGLMNLDFADFRNVVRQCGGSLVMATAEAEGENRAQTILADFRHNALLEQGDVLGRAQGLLVGVIGGPDMTLNELQRIVSGITESARTDVPMHLGTSIDQESRGRISVTVLAAEQLGSAVPETADLFAGAAADEGPETPVPDPAAEEAPVPKKSAVRNPGKAVQPSLPLEGTVGRGRFVNVQPTLYEGQDLDVPTYLRRKIKLSSAL